MSFLLIQCFLRIVIIFHFIISQHSRSLSLNHPQLSLPFLRLLPRNVNWAHTHILMQRHLLFFCYPRNLLLLLSHFRFLSFWTSVPPGFSVILPARPLPASSLPPPSEVCRWTLFSSFFFFALLSLLVFILNCFGRIVILLPRTTTTTSRSTSVKWILNLSTHVEEALLCSTHSYLKGARPYDAWHDEMKMVAASVWSKEVWTSEKEKKKNQRELQQRKKRKKKASILSAFFIPFLLPPPQSFHLSALWVYSNRSFGTHSTSHLPCGDTRTHTHSAKHGHIIKVN